MTNRPRVTWVVAVTLDGRVAAPDVSPRTWISSQAARLDTRRLRDQHDAVLFGSGTARTDDPLLGLGPDTGERHPLRIVLDARAEIVSTGSRFASGPGSVLVVIGSTVDAARIARGVEVIRLPTDPFGRFSLRTVLDTLAQRGIAELLVEAGPTLAGNLLAAGLVDRVVAYVAPLIVGAGPAAVTIPGAGDLAAAHRFSITSITRIGDDVRIDLERPVADDG